MFESRDANVQRHPLPATRTAAGLCEDAQVSVIEIRYNKMANTNLRSIVEITLQQNTVYAFQNTIRNTEIMRTRKTVPQTAYASVVCYKPVQ